MESRISATLGDLLDFAIWQYDLRTSMEKKYKVKECDTEDFKIMKSWTKHRYGWFNSNTKVLIRNKVTLRFAAESK